MYVDLSSCLSYERRNEKKLVLKINRKLIQRLFKVGPTPKTAPVPISEVRSEISSVDPNRPLSDQQAMAPSKKPKKTLAGTLQGLVCCHCPSSCSLYFLLYMSPANKTVPDVSSKTIAEARAVIEGQDLQVGEEKEEYSDSGCRRLRHSNQSNAGAQKKEQSRIDLIISKGPNSFEMPNYVKVKHGQKAEEDLKILIKYQAK